MSTSVSYESKACMNLHTKYLMTFGVADQYLGGVLLLAGRSPVEILPEGCLNPCTVTEKLLKGRRRKRFQIVGVYLKWLLTYSSGFQ